MTNEEPKGGYLLETILLMLENGGFEKEIETILRLYMSCYGYREILERNPR